MARAPEAATGGRIVSISTVLFDGYPIEQAIEEIGRSGAAYVEPAFIRGYVDFTEDDFRDEPAGRLLRLARGAGLSIHAVSAHMDLSLAGAGVMLERRIGFAEALGAKVLITNAGPASRVDAILSTVERLLPRLVEWGGILAIENPGHGSGDLIGSARDGRAFVNMLGSPHVRLNHDAGNVFTYSHERLQPADDYRAARDAIGHVHLKDIERSEAGWRFCAIGSGDVDLAAYLAAIPADLPLSLELPLRLSRPGRGDPQRNVSPRPLAELNDALAQSLDFLKQVRRA